MHVSTTARALFNRLRYKHLLMLVTLGNSQNLHRAAQALNMSQPATSRMLQEIEEAFGCELFERQSRGMRPNALGEEVLQFARKALTNLDRCAEDITERQQGGYGYLSIGTIMGAAPDLVVQSIAEMKRQYPRLRLRIMGDTSDQLIELLDQGSIDLAVARRSFESDRSRYVFEPLGNEHLTVVVHAGHALSQRDRIDLSELVNDWPWILQPASSPARAALENSFERLSLPSPRDIIECSSVFAMLQLVQMTDAILVLSETVLTDYLKTDLVVALPIEIEEEMAPYGVLLRKNEPLSHELKLFLDLLRNRARRLSSIT
ncbi:DNA-binding transcriptional LysR family regulator [Pseudomonas duriflava]|uniref:DNA-binding transcriptional LysR family regulator n=1 Tax=Pseudomonas duriflava TaxID=459528 RepID=A0A562QJ60_9PSED|nr:LysR family transcriptional regulator [Pseudomonas duriflava]TWI56774.1 DNA-binding transcriptional LysR family regulator [Pseudomonas duriflava]